jgi:hypothetical protein
MGEKHLLGACPLLSSSRYFIGLELPLVEIRNRVDDDPRDAASKVDDLGAQEFISATHSMQYIYKKQKNGAAQSFLAL